VALIAGLADERKGRREGLKIYENGKISAKMFCKKGTTVVKILGNNKIWSKYSRNRKEPGDFRENLLENGISPKNR
jgi:hypothetical protein